jgi:hypothetical protein
VLALVSHCVCLLLRCISVSMSITFDLLLPPLLSFFSLSSLSHSPSYFAVAGFSTMSVARRYYIIPDRRPGFDALAKLDTPFGEKYREV